MDNSGEERFEPCLSVATRLALPVWCAGGPASWLIAFFAVNLWRLAREMQLTGMPPHLVAETRQHALSGLGAAILVGAVHAYVGFRILLYARRGFVVLGPSGIHLADWRGHTEMIRWTDVRRMHVVTCAGLRRPPSVTVSADMAVARISSHLHDRERLISEIARRGNLVQESRNWLRTTYSRV